MVIEHTFNDYTFRSTFNFNKDGLVILVSSEVTNVTDKNYIEGERKGMDIKSSAINITHNEAKQLANFIMKFYKEDKSG